MRYYIASCVFTRSFPALSQKIQNYAKRSGLCVVRCCVPKYKLAEFENAMPEGCLREEWKALPDCAAFLPGDEVISLCHNCSNIIEETSPGVAVRSLWEWILKDPAFPFPDLKGKEAFVQDCWRSRERTEEQNAVRRILEKLGASVLESAPNRGDCDFCGASLFRPQPPRNPKLAPRHYLLGAEGKFRPHSPEEQQALMRGFCARFSGKKVVCYCHYCLEGLLLGGADAVHLASVLF